MSKLTKWEVGQDLIKASNCLSEVIDDIRNSVDSDSIKTLRYALALIGGVFNENNDHKFGIYDSKCWAKDYPDK